MAVIASVAYPRILSTVALLGLTLLASHEQPASREHVVPWPGAGAVAWPEIGLHADAPDVVHIADFRDARPWNHGGMVIAPARSDAAINIALANPVVALLSGLFDVIGSLPV